HTRCLSDWSSDVCSSDLVAAGLHIHLSVAAVEDDALLDGRRLGERGIDVLLKRHDLAAPPAAVGRDDEAGLGVVVAVGDGVGARSEERRVGKGGSAWWSW